MVSVAQTRPMDPLYVANAAWLIHVRVTSIPIPTWAG